jgi:hypothetical protein
MGNEFVKQASCTKFRWLEQHRNQIKTHSNAHSYAVVIIRAEGVPETMANIKIGKRKRQANLK